MKLRVVLLTLGALAMAGEAKAQSWWDTPSFMPPRPGEDIGVYLTDGDGTNIGIQGIWRQRGNLNLGLRLGFVDTDGDGLVLVGVETWDRIISTGPDFPVDINWTLGGGAAFADGVRLSIPLGLSVGRTFVTTPLTFQVYGHPRVALEVVSFNDQTDTDLEMLFDLGGEAHLGRDWKVRLGVTLGGYDAWGLGFAYRFGRQVEVR